MSTQKTKYVFHQNKIQSALCICAREERGLFIPTVNKNEIIFDLTIHHTISIFIFYHASQNERPIHEQKQDQPASKE